MSSGTSVNVEASLLVAGERNDGLWMLCGDGRSKIDGLSEKFAEDAERSTADRTTNWGADDG
ncbi:hypothetical protein [uncultured Corynebacterium sp.]|uniref:hypothetical protein n=1 Tax=uncultured Corynebacterium sp. TaxID=159447 RepID=UPI0026396284|nr:hypothetical protein [uncultured Corynebacterium sp.]